MLGDLLVAFNRRALITGGRPAIDPRVAGAVEPLTHKAQLLGVQYIRNMQQHLEFPWPRYVDLPFARTTGRRNNEACFRTGSRTLPAACVRYPARNGRRPTG